MTRENAIEMLKSKMDGHTDTSYEWAETVRMAIKALEQQKTGHWVNIHPLQADDEGAYMCSCCKVGNWGLKGTENYYPNCGAKMEIETKIEQYLNFGDQDTMMPAT